MTALAISLGFSLLVVLLLYINARKHVQRAEAERANVRKEFATTARQKRDLEDQIDRRKREEPTREARSRRELLTPIVEIDDHVRRALEHLDESAPPDLRKGLEMLASELDAVWQRCGLTPIAPTPGTPFDPERHEALTARESPGADTRSIETLYTVGFLDGDHLLRPARVAVLMPSKKEEADEPVA